MATKAQLEGDYARYQQACAAVTQSAAGGDYSGAVQAAQGSLPLVHPAVTFRRRFLKAEPAAPTVDLILRYAPALFQRAAADAVEAWCAGGSKTERAALPEIPDRLASARHRLAFAAELWAALGGTAEMRPAHCFVGTARLGSMCRWRSVTSCERLTFPRPRF